MTLFNHEEDIQYFIESAELTADQTKKKYCERTIKLLEEAHHIYVFNKKGLAKKED